MLVIGGWVWNYYFSPSNPNSCTRTTIKHTYLDELNQMMMYVMTVCGYDEWEYPSTIDGTTSKAWGVVFWVDVIDLTTWVGAQSDGPSLLSIPLHSESTIKNPIMGKVDVLIGWNQILWFMNMWQLASERAWQSSLIIRGLPLIDTCGRLPCALVCVGGGESRELHEVQKKLWPKRLEYY
jgi:hypothetical protein